jgi:diacylglycerol kinase (ATP)
MKILVIGNPIAGTGQADRWINVFARALEQHGHDVQVFMSKRSGEALEKAGAIDGDIDRIVVAGGDGTVNEVINGLSDPKRIPILHLPTGTANQLARSLDLPFDPYELANILEHGSIRRIDMGLVENHRFLLLVSSGFDARVAREVKKSRNDTLGYAGYVVPILRACASHRAHQLHVIIDDKQTIPGCNVMVLKVRQYGGVLVFAEEARLDSGHFEVCIFQQGSIPWMSLYAVAGLVGKATELPGVIRVRARMVRIESEDPIPVEIDGDHFGITPVNIQMQPSVVPVIVPNSAPQ